MTLEDVLRAIEMMRPGGEIDRRDNAMRSAIAATEATEVDGGLRVSCGEFTELVPAPYFELARAIARVTAAYVEDRMKIKSDQEIAGG